MNTNYVILEEEPSKSSYESLSNVANLQISWRLRLLFLLLSFFSLLWFFLSCMGLALSSTIYLLTMRKIGLSKTYVGRFWKGVRRAPAFTLGFFIAPLAPSLGLGFIVLYFIFCEKNALPLFEGVLKRFR